MFGTGLGRYLPSPIRHRLNFAFAKLQTFSPPNFRKSQPRKKFDGRQVAVVGLFTSATGLGRAAELVALALQRRGSTVIRVDISGAYKRRMFERNDVIDYQGFGEAAVSDVVFVVNPDIHPLYLFDNSWLAGRCVIGHWIWELETLPAHWRRLAVSYDELWAPTDLVRSSIQAAIPAFDGSLKVVAYAIDADPMKRIDLTHRASVRKRLQLSESMFVGGYSFSADSNYYRKNPEAAVNAFQKAFPLSDKAARLILRSNDLEQWPIEHARLLELIGSDNRIILFGAKTRIAIDDFYAVIDVYLSPSRAEGYGLNLVEAAQAGIPVITTGWRLPPEILALPGVCAVPYTLDKVFDPQRNYSKQAQWATPNLSEMAAELIRTRARHISSK